MVRVGYAAALCSYPEISLVGQTGSATKARGLAAAARPDVMVLDASLPEFDGLTLGEQLRADRPEMGIVLVGPCDDDLLFRSLTERFSAYLPRTATLDLLMSAIRHAAVAPTAFMSPDLAAALARRRAAGAVLSPREIEVLRHLCGGSTNAKIAGTLHLTESTVRTYLARVYDKLGVHSRAQALVAASERGLL